MLHLANINQPTAQKDPDAWERVGECVCVCVCVCCTYLCCSTASLSGSSTPQMSHRSMGGWLSCLTADV